jgi:hypothetical protein
MVFGRESGTTGKASHRGHGGHRGGIWVGGEEFDRRQPWRLGENPAQRGKHRTEVMEVTEGGFGWRPGIRLATTMAAGRESGATGKASHRGHRGGIWGGGQEFDRRQSWRLGENRVQRGKHRTEVTAGGFGLVAGNSIGDNMAAGRESGATGKASHRGHRGHRGGLGLVARNSIGDNMVFGRESGATGKASHGGHKEVIGIGGQEVDR